VIVDHGLAIGGAHLHFWTTGKVASRRDILKIARRLNAGFSQYRHPVPQGRLKTAFLFNRPCGTRFFQTFPGIEMPGYFRLFLRNRTTAQQLRRAPVDERCSVKLDRKAGKAKDIGCGDASLAQR
jgi:hypothetical protein